jgi:hypothetical protein
LVHAHISNFCFLYLQKSSAGIDIYVRTVIVPRNNGATYRISWQAAIASHPTWITITSFNEWFEGAMIESGVHYGDQYLRLTAQLASQWRQ